jgi:predicted ester cyclase
MVAQSFSNLSDAILRVEDMVAEGDKVVTRWTMTATHSGEFMGVPPTDRRLTMSGIIIDRFVDGRVVEAWESFDMHGLMAQLTEEGSRL